MYYTRMNRIFLFSVLLLAACSTAPRMPVDVALVPDDCANRESISRWLEQTARAPKPWYQSRDVYEQNQTAIKARLWQLRYNCQRVR